MASYNTQYTHQVNVFASNLTVVDSVISANKAPMCAGLYATGTSAATLTNVSVLGNVAATGPGGAVCSRAETALALCGTSGTVVLQEQTGTLAVVAPGSTYGSTRCSWAIMPRDLPGACSVALQFSMVDLNPVHVGVGSDFVTVYGTGDGGTNATLLLKTTGRYTASAVAALPVLLSQPGQGMSLSFDSTDAFGSGAGAGQAQGFQASYWMACTFLGAPYTTLNATSLVVKGGAATANSALGAMGGAVFVNTAAQPAGIGISVQLLGAALANNTAASGGAGVWAGAGVSLLLSSGSITGGTAGDSGAAVNITGGSSLTVDGTLLADNAAGGVGGGISCAGSTPVILRGGAALINNSATSGGGLYAAPGCVLDVGGGVAMTLNRATNGNGGAVYAGDLLRLSAANFSTNAASASGGAVCASGSAWLSIDGSSFSGNRATGANPRGGAVAAVNVPAVSLTNSVLSGNQVVTVFPALRIGDSFTTFYGSSEGGALALAAEKAAMAVTIAGCTFSGNSAPAGGAVAAGGNATTSMRNSTLSGNSAASGGALSIADGAQLTASGCTLWGNVASGVGGALHLANTDLSGISGSATLANCTFVANSAQEGAFTRVDAAGSLTAAGCTVLNGSAMLGGAFSYSTAASLMLADMAIVGNTAAAGGIYFCDAPLSQPACGGACVVAGNGASSYGPLLATRPVAVALTAPASVRSGGNLQPLALAMVDGYNQTVVSWPDALVLFTSDAPAVLLGSVRTTYDSAFAQSAQVALFGVLQNASYTLHAQLQARTPLRCLLMRGSDGP